MKHRYGLLRIALLVCLFLAISGLHPAAAADSLSPKNTILVNIAVDEYDTSGSGAGCSLREAIQSANTDTAFGGCTAGSGVDLIIFSGSITTFQLTIPGTDLDDNKTGDLNIETPMTIQGNGEGATIIDAFNENPRTRIFVVEDPDNNISVTIKSLSIINGNSRNQNGGAIFNRDTLILEDVAITSSRSNTAGGAIYSSPLMSSSQSLTLTRCTISDNVATLGGGGIAGSGIMNIEDSVFSNNWSSSPTEGKGGALAILGGNFSITHTVFDDNQASVNGGNIYLSAFTTGPYLIENSVITNGSVATGDGGNIYATSDPDDTVFMTIRNTEISSGAAYAGNGGGIYNDLSLTLENVTLSGNNANYGGGLYTASAHSAVVINNSTVTRNNQTVTGQGDGIYNAASGALGFKNSIFANNGYIGDPSGHGTDCGGSLAGPPSLDYNLDRGDSCVFEPATHDLTYTDPQLGSMGHNLGFSRSFPLLAGSPAIDAGNNATCKSTDQRGWVRPVDGNNDGTATCDIGAYEYGHTLHFLPLILHLTYVID
jgi:CSLREA domain-containing protein